MLTQFVNGERRVISYFSRAVPKHQQSWPATKLEFVCMHTCLMHWRIYLQGAKHFKCYTDCRALLNFHTIFQRGNAAMQRKLADLAGFNMTILHISGESNIIPDVLSRYPYENNTRNIGIQTDSVAPQVNQIKCNTANTNNKSNCITSKLTLVTIIKAQKDDILLAELRAWLKNGKRPENIQEINAPYSLIYYYRQFSLFYVKNDVLYYKWRLKSNEISDIEKNVGLIVVPQSLYETVIRLYHDGIENCHSGIENSLDA